MHILDDGSLVDLAITAYLMPGMNCLEFMSALKKRVVSADDNTAGTEWLSGF
jgi:CheY-like chemotaxis protein